MPIAGGTELLNWMRLGIATPDRLIGLGRTSIVSSCVPLGKEARAISELLLKKVEVFVLGVLPFNENLQHGSLVRRVGCIEVTEQADIAILAEQACFAAFAAAERKIVEK